MTAWVRLGSVLTPEEEVVSVSPADSYPIAGVYGFGRGVFVRDTISGADTKYTSLRRLSANQVVYSKLKAFEGAVAVVGPETAGRFVSQEFPTFSIGPDIDTTYLSHYLQWGGFVGQMKSGSTGVGARRERLHSDKFLALEVPLPEIGEQRRIATHLDHLGLATERLQRPLGPDELIDGIFRQLDWSGAMSDLVHPATDEVVVKESECYRAMGVYGHGRGAIYRGPMMGSDTKYRKLHRVAAGQVVLSRLKAFEGAVTLVPASLDGAVVSQEFLTFSLNRETVPGFLWALLTRERFFDAMKAKSTGVGARRERLSVEGFMGISVPTPSVGPQEKIATAAETARRAQGMLTKQQAIGRALLPAARNEVFSSLR